jgi:DNA-binding transcriptional ArsR family regulator
MKRDENTREPDISATAALIGDPSRAAILKVLLDGRAMPASDLARVARISPQTASSHLEKLVAGRLLAVEKLGRHRYYRLPGSEVADLLEQLSNVSAPSTPPVRTDALALGRTCYGHLAGRLGVAITNALVTRDFLGADMAPTATGKRWFLDLDIDAGHLKRTPIAKPCLDWSERKHHLAGSLGVAFTSRMFELEWLARTSEPRIARLTVKGSKELRTRLGLAFDF